MLLSSFVFREREVQVVLEKKGVCESLVFLAKDGSGEA
jgi:hypothetical protein